MEQVIANILVLSARYTLTALGVSIIYRFSGCLDFAQGAIYIVSAYCSYIFAQILGLPLVIAILLGAVIGATCGGFIDFIIYRQIRKIARPVLSVLLASLGLLICTENLMALSFGEASRSLPLGDPRPGILIFGARVTEIQIAVIILALTVPILVWLTLNRTRFGLMLRSYGSNYMLAASVGIPIKKTFLRGAVLGSFLSGLAGTLITLETSISPTMGNEAVLMGVLVTLIGGAGNIVGALGAAMLIAAIEGFAGTYINLLWREVITFTTILVIICVRPKRVFRGKGY